MAFLGLSPQIKNTTSWLEKAGRTYTDALPLHQPRIGADTETVCRRRKNSLPFMTCTDCMTSFHHRAIGGRTNASNCNV